MTHHEYKTHGTCSRSISFDLDGDTVHNVKFSGGCDGNSKGVSALVEGKSVDEVESLLSGITCGMKSTSCPDQLAKAVRAAVQD